MWKIGLLCRVLNQIVIMMTMQPENNMYTDQLDKSIPYNFQTQRGVNYVCKKYLVAGFETCPKSD